MLGRGRSPSTLTVLAFDSATLGSSKGSTSRACPAMATASSKRRNSVAERSWRVEGHADDVPVVPVLVLGRRHGDAASAELARRLGDELFDPQPEGADRLVDDDRGLVTSGQGGASHVLAERDGFLAVCVEGAFAQLGDLVAHESRRDEAEEREHRVASADVGPVLEQMTDAELARLGAERGARVGDDGVAARVGDPAAGVGEEHVGLERGARLRGDDDERVLEGQAPPRSRGRSCRTPRHDARACRRGCP